MEAAATLGQFLAEIPGFEAANQFSFERGVTAKLSKMVIARLGQRVQQPLTASYYLKKPCCSSCSKALMTTFLQHNSSPEWRLDARNCVAGVRGLWDKGCALFA
jgi:hypothetical protein